MALDLIGAVIGPIIGTVGTLGGQWMNLKAKKQDYAHDLEVFKHEVDMRAQDRIAAQEANEQAISLNAATTETDIAKTQIKGSYDGLLASIDADAKIPMTGIWANLKGMVRPALTIFAVATATFMCYYAVNIDVKEAASATALTDASMAFAWWFGDRNAAKQTNKLYK